VKHFFLFSISLIILSCSSVSTLLAATNHEQILERYRPRSIKEPLLNKSNRYRIKLGKALFFDPRLSGSNWISCATCHNPTLGWSDGLPTAIGHGQNKLKRATPTIINTAYGFLQMWDGRFDSLEHQAMGPIESSSEMHQALKEVVHELSNINGYREMFKDAYPGRGINRETISAALAAFQRSIITTDAPFDRWIKGDETAINDAAKRGFELFEGKGHCSTCHAGYNFTDDGFHNIGLDDDDIGRYAVVKIPVLKGAFKTPTLRNIALTAPYMHNGAYKTLEQVIQHYVRGGVRKDNLSPNFKKANLNKYQVADLVEFLKTLTSDPIDISYPVLPK